MYCRSCGTFNDDNNFRCMQCGTMLQSAGAGAGGFGAAAQSWPEPSKADSALIFGVLGLLVCQVLAIVGFVMARDELKGIELGQRDPSKLGTAKAAWWLSVISLGIFVLSLLVVAGAVGFVLIGA